ncbi:D-alanyl-D-alanine carboxypeptidase family protein [Paenibacillus sp. CF384]|uniref:D-alanyl-D-alanine carboxypeptidase family protein n=1 Tax=Paenibacillus sp. CF384 TaxID=1884382 RepID=UPI00089C2A0D|nr:D-alanyl-D-alanine carboxypeptidase family protein [Paenibacillus sp. CF384]SDX51152.1 D-alanyl-D-alanine carboxypeptidase/D-alanyl-D-alanine carboxypeptidase (penicillin-binding protein 5/6) [Paenibacillus sp. CF384]
MAHNTIKRISALLLLIQVFCFAVPVYAEEAVQAEPNLASESAILMDAQTGTVLFSKNAEKQQFPASITKIVTGIVALEYESVLSNLVTVSKEARGEEGTRIYLAEGEQVSLERLLYGMLMNSGNDAATAIAEYIDGSKAKFAERMNAFVKEKAGAEQTNFVNPSGLPDEAQVTTALDMARISRYAMQNEMFRTIVATKRMPWVGKEWTSSLINHNQMLKDYEGTTGIKNGYTEASGFTLVTSAKRDGMELIGVLLKSPSKTAVYKDMTDLLDYGFAHFELRQLITANESYPFTSHSPAEFVAKEPLWAVLPKGETPAITVTSQGKVWVQSSIGTVDAGTMEPVKPELPVSVASVTPSPEEDVKIAADVQSDEPSGSTKLTILVIWLSLLVYLAVLAYLRLKRQKQERSRGL